MKPRPSKRTTFSPGADGFTLIELLVVIAIIAILVAMLLPEKKNMNALSSSISSGECTCLILDRPAAASDHLFYRAYAQ